MNPFRKLITPAAEPKVEVELTRNAFIAGVAYSAGEKITASKKVVNELIAAGSVLDRAADDTEAAEAARLEALIPPPVPAAPLPKNWLDLPPAFHELWAMEESANALIERRSLIWETLMATMNRFRTVGDNVRGLMVTYNHSEAGAKQKIHDIIAGLHIGHLPDSHLREIRFLKDAFQRSEQAVRDWHAENGDRWTKANFHASQFVLKKHGELCKAIRELHSLGRQIFGARIAGLGLGEAKQDELFRSGSADALKYAGIEPPGMNDLKLAWSDDTGQMFYLAKSPATMFYLVREYEATGEQVAALTKQARAELTKANRVSAAA